MAACLVWAFAASTAGAAPGDLDPTFSEDGVATTSFGRYWAGAKGIALQADGKLVTAGYSNQGAPSGLDLALARHNQDGSLDPGFGGDGTVTTDVGRIVDSAVGLAVRPDGKVIAAGGTGDIPAGQQAPPFRDVVLARYLADGSPDPSFSGDGIEVSRQVRWRHVWDMAVQEDGKILVTGEVDDDRAPLAVVRFLADGTLDESFSGDGLATIALPGERDHAFAISLAIQPDGKIVVAGGAYTEDEHGSPGPTSYLVGRYLPNGSPDSTFSGDGIARATPEEGAQRVFRAVTVQPDGRIVAAGGHTDPWDSCANFAVARYREDGTLDPAFAGDGIQTAGIMGPTQCETANAVLVQPNGKVVAAGHLDTHPQNTAGGYVALARYLPDGAFDPSFSEDGQEVTGGALQLESTADDILLQPDGKLVAAGYSNQGPVGGSIDFALVRYEGDPASPPGTSTPPDRAGTPSTSTQLDPLVAPPAGVHGPIGSSATSPAFPRPTCMGRVATVLGTAGSEVLKGTPGRDVIAAGAGDDRVRGLAGGDVICGGPGRDRLWGGAGADRLSGGAGNDRLVSDRRDQIVRGGPGRDRAGRDGKAAPARI